MLTVVGERKSFNTTLTPGGALYFHELIVEARNSAFCRTRVAWCIPSSKTYLPRRLRATFHNVPGMFPPRVRNAARESKWRRGHGTIAGLLSVRRAFRPTSPRPATLPYEPVVLDVVHSTSSRLPASHAFPRLDDSSARSCVFRTIGT